MKWIVLTLSVGMFVGGWVSAQTSSGIPVRQGAMGAGLRPGGLAADVPASAQVVCASGTPAEGVDVSSFNGTIDWSQVKASGRAFAVARVSDGTAILDAKFATNWAGMKAAGIVRGAYQFFEPAQDAVAQANVLLTRMGTLDPTDLAPTLDVEITGGQPSATVVSGISQWVATVKQATGLTPYIYSSASFWTGIGNPDLSANLLWVANIGASCPSLPAGWTNWNIWQYSFTGSVAGIAGSVDSDRFNGALPTGTPPAFSTQPSNQAVIAGVTATFSVAASGSPSPTYQWQTSANGGTTWTDLANAAPYSGVTTATLTVTGAAASLNAAQYRAVATNSLGTATSTAATITVYGAMTLTPSALRFGATRAAAGGDLTAVTATQAVSVTFSGEGSAWTATADQSWLQITGGSGIGDCGFTVAIVNPNNVIGASTSLAATITVTALLAPNSPVLIPVTLTVDQAGNSTQPAFGQVDTPVQGAAGVVGAIGVTGWAVDDVGVSGVKIYRNCLAFENQASCQTIQGHNVVFIGDAAFVAGARPDVEAAFSSFPSSNVAGWGYLLLTNMLPHVPNQFGYGGEGSLTLYAFATDLEGHVTLLGRSQDDHTPTSITMDNDHIAKPFGAIDTPSQGGTVSGPFANFGWVLTPDSNTTAEPTDVLVPTNGSTMHVFIDGGSVGTVTYNQCRGNVGNPVPAGLYCNDDVADIFGNATPQPVFTTRTANATLFRNLDAGRSAIGSFDVDTSSLANGIHSIAWGVTDSAGRSEGIGSRNFFVLNACAPPAQCPNSGSVPDLSRDLSLAPVQPRGDAASLPQGVAADARVLGRTGFDLATPLEEVPADATGARRVRMPDLGRIELDLGGSVETGYLVVGDTLRDLPIGSHLDGQGGIFTWAPAPGFLGTYHLAFVRGGPSIGPGASEQIPVDVTIRPMAPAAAGESEIRLNVDLPVSGATTTGAVTIAGWALDPQAWTGSGIGAVHVWAYRRDAPSTGPQFVGAADLRAARPDVAAAFGAQFGTAGFGLITMSLEPGDYDLIVYAWCDRTGRWEDARTVRVTVKARKATT